MSFHFFKWIVFFIDVVLIYLAIENFKKHRLLAEGFNDKRIQEFVDNTVEQSEYKNKAMLYLILCAASWVFMLFFSYNKDIYGYFKEIANVQSPKVVEIRGGHMVNIDGKNVPISGTSQCVSDEKSQDCIVITPETKVVEVWVGFPDGPLKEAWTVKKVGDQMLLNRGGGSYIFQAK
ncbi:hypothetical protein ACET94_16605 [Aeromonas veronii]